MMFQKQVKLPKIKLRTIMKVQTMGLRVNIDSQLTTKLRMATKLQTMKNSQTANLLKRSMLRGPETKRVTLWTAMKLKSAINSISFYSNVYQRN